MAAPEAMRAKRWLKSPLNICARGSSNEPSAAPTNPLASAPAPAAPPASAAGASIAEPQIKEVQGLGGYNLKSMKDHIILCTDVRERGRGRVALIVVV